MARARMVEWSTLGDRPLDPGQRDALLLTAVRAKRKASEPWQVPSEWPGAWVTTQRPAGKDSAHATAESVWLSDAGSWLAGSKGWALPASGRRPDPGWGITLGLHVRDQVSLWRGNQALTHADVDDSANTVADRRGPRLAECDDLPKDAADADWPTADLPGWTAGGELDLNCSQHGGPLRHWRCDHRDALGHKRRFLVGCPDCSLPQMGRLGQRLGDLLIARAALDGELPTTEAGAESTHRVYVVEVRPRKKPAGFYVGCTDKNVNEAVDELADSPALAGNRVGRKAKVGDVRPDLVSQPWTLPTASAGLAAQSFTHRWLEVREPGTSVWGDVSVLA